MSKNINDKVDEFLDNTKEISTLRKQITIFSKKNKELENEIKSYLINNNLDSISLANGEVFIYDKKINDTFKSENMINNIKTELSCDDNKAEKIVKSITENKSYSIQKGLKTKHKV